MGLARLDDVEYARRARERNNRVNAAHRQRLLDAGKAQTNVWLSAEMRALLESEAVSSGASLSVVTEELLQDGLSYRRALSGAANSTPAPDDLFSETAPVNPAPTLTKEERIQRIIELKRTGLSNYAIGDQLGCSEATVRRALEPKKNASQTESTI